MNTGKKTKKRLPKGILEWVKAHGEELERFGMVVNWRRDGGFTVLPERKQKGTI